MSTNDRLTPYRLESLPSLGMQELTQLPDAPGVYIVFTAMTAPILYVGQAVSLKKRLCGHSKRALFLTTEAARVAWILSSYDELSALEVVMLHQLSPLWNKSHRAHRRPVTEAAQYERLTLRLPSAIIATLREEADAIGRPLNTHILHVLRRGLAAGKETIAVKRVKKIE